MAKAVKKAAPKISAKERKEMAEHAKFHRKMQKAGFEKKGGSYNAKTKKKRT